MALVYPLDTPSRVLRRVQQLEDVELPTLPSFQLDLEYDSGTSASGEDNNSENAYAQYAEGSEAVRSLFSHRILADCPFRIQSTPILLEPRMILHPQRRSP